MDTPVETTVVTTSVAETPVVKRFQTKEIIEVALQLIALAFLLIFCFNVLAPFFEPVIWAAILAVALYPLHQRLKVAFKGKGTWAAVLITFLMVALLVLPAVWLTITTASQVKDVATAYKAGQITIPPPTEKVKSWPLIGNKAYGLWTSASTNLDSLIQENPETVKSVAGTGIALFASTGKGILFITIAIIISGVFLSYSTQSADFAKRLFQRLLHSKTFDMTSLAASTIRNVVKGILGVALIQSALVGAGLFIAGIPYAGVWIFLCVILAIVQIGILPVSIGVIIYIWSTGDNLTATLLTIWMLAVGLLDNVLKPILMGKGAAVPMLVIFLGAIGGFVFSGFIGLFTGAVVLSLGYRLFIVWLKGTEI
jgi:predicted PurR-regulated permease PerM